MLPLKCTYFLLLTLILKSNAAVFQQKPSSNNVGNNLRIRRQDGYVYNKPNISFDLPSQSTTESTQAPTVDRILEQQMYYAYPAPAGGDAIKIGSTSGTKIGTTTTSASEGASSGYTYQSSTAGRASYKYLTPVPGPKETQANIASQVLNTASKTIVSSTSTASDTNSDSKTNSEYSYKAPSLTLPQSYQSSSEVSTNAPRYLPPAAGSSTGSLGGEGKINIGSGSGISGAELLIGSNIATQTGSSSVGALSENYLPPLINNVGSTSKTPEPVSISSQINGSGAISVPSMAYLPPKSSPSSTPLQTLGLRNASQNAEPVKEYIPPVNTGSQSGTVAAPASGYLPPGFF